MTTTTASFKGFDDYIEIFRGGQQTDSSGKVHDGDALVDRAVASFNVARHEPPLVVGHPKENGPAFGWVEGLTSQLQGGAKVLLAKFRQVAPEFEKLARAGRFKKRSASFYPDGSLRHVGFLGAAPPAVKGLADVAFSADDQAVTFDFGETDWSIARVFRNLREWLLEKEGAETADRICPDYTINDIQRAAEQDPPKPAADIAAQPLFTEGTMPTIEELQQQLAAEQARRLAAETKAASFEEQVKTTTLEFTEAENTRKRQEIATAIEQGIKAGTILPGWKAMGLASFMEGLAGVAPQGAVLEFAEGEHKHKVDQGQWFQRFLANFSSHPLFKEMVKPVDANNDFAEGADFTGLTKFV